PCRALVARAAATLFLTVAAVFLGCRDQQGGGLLGILGQSSEPTPIDPLALPAASQPTGPSAEADRAIHAWISDALAAGTRIDVQKAPTARTVIANLVSAPPLPQDVSVLWSFGDGVIRGGVPASHAYGSA